MKTDIDYQKIIFFILIIIITWQAHRKEIILKDLQEVLYKTNKTLDDLDELESYYEKIKRNKNTR